ncbi:MAG: translocation/assembly module TamB domain-containing protein [Gammaproteobacteria bacterium]|nr:translocation/assembly module TamB domain-containing protein [Gammaproteobacteria bacterium]
MKNKALLIYSLSVLSIVILGMYLLLYTAAGFTWYINRNLSGSDGSVSIDKVDYTLSGNYIITGLKYTAPNFKLNISKLELAWNPLSLLRQQVDIHSMEGESVSLQLMDSKMQSVTSESYVMPFVVQIHQGSIRNLTMAYSDAFRESFQNVKFEQVYFYDNMFANKIIFTAANGGAFEISGNAGLHRNDVINLTTKATFTIPNTNKVIFSQGTIVGTPAHLKFLQQTKSPYAFNLTGTVANLFENPRFDFSVNVHSITGEAIHPDLKVAMLEGELNGNGSLSETAVNGKFRLKDDLANWWTISLAASLVNGNADFNFVSTRSPPTPGPGQIEVKGQWQFGSSEPFPRSVSIAGTVDNLRWPVNDDSVFQVRQGAFRYDGATLRSDINLKELNIETTGTHLTELVLHTGSDDGKRITLSGKATTAGGSLKFAGDLNKQVLGYRVANFSLTGQNFALVRKPKAHIIISPDLTFSRNDHSIQSSGVIKVPTANIQLHGISETYQQVASLFFPSQNVNSDPADSTRHFKLEFGDAVWLHGYGLNANVTGGLAIANQAKNGLIANGNLNVLRGNYTNNNRKFMVAGGLLKFENKHLDNPDLELEVVEKQMPGSKPAIIRGPLQTLHKAREKPPIEELSQHAVRRIALNN